MSLVRFRPEAPFDAGVAHPVERHLAKVEVASSSLVTRSNFIWYRGQVVRQRSAKPSFPSSNLGGTSKNPECVCIRDFYLFTHHFFTLNPKFPKNYPLKDYMRQNGLTLKKILLELDKIKTIQYPGSDEERLLNPLTKRQREIYALLEIPVPGCMG